MNRADVADIKLCLLSLEELFPSSHTSDSSFTPSIDPLTLDLIDSNTLILLNKTDSISPSPSQLSSISSSLTQVGKSWLGKGSEKEFWQVSVKEGTGLRELAKGLTAELKRR